MKKCDEKGHRWFTTGNAHLIMGKYICTRRGCDETMPISARRQPPSEQDRRAGGEPAGR